MVNNGRSLLVVKSKVQWESHWLPLCFSLPWITIIMLLFRCLGCQWCLIIYNFSARVSIVWSQLVFSPVNSEVVPYYWLVLISANSTVATTSNKPIWLTSTHWLATLCRMGHWGPYHCLISIILFLLYCACHTESYTVEKTPLSIKEW